MNVSPANIYFLEKNQVFVYGSNSRFIHGAGAAKTALRKFGAKIGVGPFCGQSYGICTKDDNIETLPISKIKIYVDKFLIYADEHPELDFLVTEIGCGLAGLVPSEIAPLFERVIYRRNIYLPQRFVYLLY